MTTVSSECGTLLSVLWLNVIRVAERRLLQMMETTQSARVEAQLRTCDTCSHAGGSAVRRQQGNPLVFDGDAYCVLFAVWHGV